MDLTCSQGHPNPAGTAQCSVCYQPLDSPGSEGESAPGVAVESHLAGGSPGLAAPEPFWDSVDAAAARSLGAAPQIAASDPAQRYGWRMTLPNHAVVPLQVGKLELGRATPDPIGPVLQLFQHVSRHHVTLNVTEEMVNVYVAQTANNPVFTVSGGSSLGAAERYQLKPITRLASIDTGRQLTLCLGQCCFIRIDRGEA